MNKKYFYFLVVCSSAIVTCIKPMFIYPGKTVAYNFMVNTFGQVFFGFVLLIIPLIIGFLIKKPLEGKLFQISLVLVMLFVYLLNFFK